MQHLSAVPLQPSPDSTPLMLAEDQKRIRIQPRPETSGLLVPATSEESLEEKQCMTVCAEWGKACVLIDQAPGVITEKCRRACKSFAEECL